MHTILRILKNIFLWIISNLGLWSLEAKRLRFAKISEDKRFVCKQPFHRHLFDLGHKIIKLILKSISTLKIGGLNLLLWRITKVQNCTFFFLLCSYLIEIGLENSTQLKFVLNKIFLLTLADVPWWTIAAPLTNRSAPPVWMKIGYY